MERKMAMGIHKDNLFVKQTNTEHTGRQQRLNMRATIDRQVCCIPSHGGF